MHRFLETDDSTPLRILEARETVELLRADGHGPLLDAIARPETLTRGGTVKASCIARVMGIPARRVSEQLHLIRQQHAA
jgi:hypothetical protein